MGPVLSRAGLRAGFAGLVVAGVTLALICVPLGEKIYDWAAAPDRVPADPGLRVLP